jgi:hypothetical protein
MRASRRSSIAPVRWRLFRVAWSGRHRLAAPKRRELGLGHTDLILQAGEPLPQVVCDAFDVERRRTPVAPMDRPNRLLIPVEGP